MSDEDKTPTRKPPDAADGASTDDAPAPIDAPEENRPHVSATTSGYAFLGLWRDEKKPNLVTMSQPNLRNDNVDLNIFRDAGTGIVNSTSAMHHEHYIQKPDSKISLNPIPPSYSTVLKLGPPITIFDSRTYPSIPFIARPPPPSYAEVHGWDDNPSVVSSDSILLGPRPVYVACPRCRIIVVSETRRERSVLSYISSVLLFICLCWPCCLLPFCIRSCNNVYHFCPRCNFYLGVYKPC